MKKILFPILMGLSFSVFAMNANEIVSKAEQASYYQGQDGRAKVTMNISDGRSRQFVILRKNFGKDQKFYVYFQRPSDVRKMSFLIHKYMQKEDDRWMFLPALDLVKRIAAGDKRTSFAGSHFYYEDVSGRDPKEDKHELVDTTDDFYVIKSTPKKSGSAEFAYYKTWIHKGTFIPTKASYYKKGDKEYRQYEALKVQKLDGFQTVTEAVMRDLESGGETKLSYNEVKYNMGLEDNLFTERYLKNPPKQYLK
ncbi:MAG: outer membrane lipoprotein-sorting protein [Alphaproteobacteria bacterium]|nr:outer membrane lipoprotein-sorting protein [Alphaproteobacteria bacterium]